MALTQRGGVLESEYLAVVGIEFGTSRSGIRIAVCGRSAIHNGKARNMVLIDADIRKVVAFGLDSLKRRVEEGFPASQLRFQQAQMNLCNSQTADPTIESPEKGQSLPLLEVLGSILDFFKEFSIAQIRETFSLDIAPHQILWNMTVPASWSEHLRDFTNKAAVHGTDPFSALLRLLQPRPEHPRLNNIFRLDVGLRFIVDVGRGSVDFTHCCPGCRLWRKNRK
eukprot:TRINITY_DN1419_c0_g1_i1.p1 TRINITY_DN1419_c0_g1~~TRINITY_DN1419_c0_g1_i1.p1  ORF type:complete len:224 (-),score=16.93 TRINITY_DN1419_c0_g1_i1:86-757(-)